MAAALLAACSGDILDGGRVATAQGDRISLSAERMHILTRAGDDYQLFDEGTAFTLFALDTDNGSLAEADWTTARIADEEGTAEAGGGIRYSPEASFGSSPIDLFGLTCGTPAKPTVVIPEKGSPTIELQRQDDGTLPDLMLSNNVKGATASDGILRMEFRHALSMLTFEVVKQVEADDDTDRRFDDARLKKVEILGCPTAGTMDIETGKWTAGDNAADPLTFYETASDADGMKIETTTQVMPGEMLVFPNETTKYQLTVRVTLSGLKPGNGVPANGEQVIEYPLHAVGADGTETSDPFIFEQNHKYRLSIIVLKNDVRVITIAPQVYDWLDIDISDDVYLGQPVTFGGLMWMDRNLGAKSADCENDFYNSMGYYYQFGRNIPFIMDIETAKTVTKNGLSFADIFGKGAYPHLIYTLDKDGRKVYEACDTAHSYYNRDSSYPEISEPHKNDSTTYFAINPGDDGRYCFARGHTYQEAIYSNEANRLTGTKASNNYSVWAYKRDVPVLDENNVVVNGQVLSEQGDNGYFWEDASGNPRTENQPVPKGWRIPTRKDVYSFMPEPDGLTWRSTDLIVILDGNTDFVENIGKLSDFLGERYEFQYFAGVYVVDNDATPTTDGLTTPKRDVNAHIYGIKYKGTQKAYRIMIEQRACKNNGSGDNQESHRYVRISRFNATAEDEFRYSEATKMWNLQEFDWSNPAEYMDMPLQGYIDATQGLNDWWQGSSGTIMRVSTKDGVGTNWTMYFRNAHKEVSVGNASRRALGDPIRLCRDVDAR